MMPEEISPAWPPELIELGILTEIHRLGFILKLVFPQAQVRGESYAATIDGANRCISTFQHLLDPARLPPELDEILRITISRFAEIQGPLPPEIVDRLWDETKRCLLRDLSATPGAPVEYQRRIRVLEERRWIGDHARAIPRGWLAIVERSVRVAEAAVTADELERAEPVFLEERFARLEWVVGGHIAKIGAVTLYAGTATRFVCMACGERGAADACPQPGDRTLTLCEQHQSQRRSDPRSFRLALYPVASEST